MTFDLRRRDWGARPPNRGYVEIGMRGRPGIETHHSVGVYGASSPEGFAFALQRDHLARNWTDAFYNAAIWTDGTTIELRPSDAQSGPIRAFTVCFAGNYDTRHLTDAQKRAWHRIRAWTLSFGAGRGVSWHNQRAQTSCPGRNVIGWLRSGHPDVPDPAPAPSDPEEDDVLTYIAFTAPDITGRKHRYLAHGIKKQRIAGTTADRELRALEASGVQVIQLGEMSREFARTFKG